MTTDWRRIEADEAKRHPLYGVGGWLIVFVVGLLLGLLRTVAELLSMARKYGAGVGELLSVDHHAVTMLKVGIAVDVATVAIVCVLLATKHRAFRATASALLICGWPFAAFVGLLEPFPGLFESLALGLIPWLLSIAVWVTYLQRSRRVRVTFESCVQASELDSASRRSPDELCAVRSHEPDESTPTAAATQADEALLEKASVASITVAPDFEEGLWARALAEFESPSRRPGLWAKVYAEAVGQDGPAKAKYLSLRVTEMLGEYRSQLEIDMAEDKQRDHQLAMARREAQALAISTAPKGRCPNVKCGAVMPMSFKECPECSAFFSGPDWCLAPIK